MISARTPLGDAQSTLPTVSDPERVDSENSRFRVVPEPSLRRPELRRLTRDSDSVSVLMVLPEKRVWPDSACMPLIATLPLTVISPVVSLAMLGGEPKATSEEILSIAIETQTATA